jgi:hypothetical protein
VFYTANVEVSVELKLMEDTIKINIIIMYTYHTVAHIVEHASFHSNRAPSLLAPHIWGEYIQGACILAVL